MDIHEHKVEVAFVLTLDFSSYVDYPRITFWDYDDATSHMLKLISIFFNDPAST